MKSRLLHAVPVLALTAASVAACGGATSYSSRCDNNVCTVSLTGAGAEAEILDDTLVVTLVGAAEGSAEFQIDDTAASCAEGDEQQVDAYTVVCTEVGDDQLTVEIS